MTKGIFSKEAHRMSFPDISERPRTDENFRNPVDEDEAETRHHKEHSIMQYLLVDMIKAFPTSDCLHLLDLGVMKKLVKHLFCAHGRAVLSQNRLNLIIVLYRLILIWMNGSYGYKKL